MRRGRGRNNTLQYFLGMDPGKSGAHAILNSQSEFISAEMWDEKWLYIIARAHYIESIPITRAVLEKVHSMPGQGVTSMFSFGTNFGMWKGMLLSNQIPFDLITPHRWMKMVLDSGNREPEHRFQYALQHWPDAPLFGPKDGERKGVADACCLAECARRIHLGIGG